MTDLSFGVCHRCSKKVVGHAVYHVLENGKLELNCAFCELDTYFKTLEDIMKGIQRIK
jgi:hypothetical protein